MATHLITGGAGFIGSHLADYLLDRGEKVIVIDNLTTGKYSNIEHLEGRSGFQCYIDDIRNETLIDELVRHADRIYHLAASVGVRLIIDKPTESLINNIVGTERVLSCASKYLNRNLDTIFVDVAEEMPKKLGQMQRLKSHVA